MLLERWEGGACVVVERKPYVSSCLDVEDEDVVEVVEEVEESRLARGKERNCEAEGTEEESMMGESSMLR